jgi:cell division protein FtsI (penicillin-binding protein 3)
VNGIERTRLKIFCLGVAAVAGIISARLVYLQIFEGARYSNLAQNQAQERIEVDLPRATLLDRNGSPLAASIPCPSLYTFDPQKVKDPAALAKAVSSLSGRDWKNIYKDLKTRKRFTWLARKLPFQDNDRAHKISDRFSGVQVMEEPGRYYPNGSIAANLIGCMGMDGGLSGLEHQWDRQLQGGKRHYLIMRDAVATRLIPMEVVSDVDPAPRTVRLTIDLPIQSRCEELLDKTVTDLRAKDGVVIVMNVHTGGILAMAVSPTFDPNDPGRYPAAWWRNRAVTDSYEPGSTMKIVTLAAALDSGRFQPYDTVDVGNGTLTVGAKIIHDDEPPLKPVYTLQEVLAHSSNVGAAKIGMALGDDTMYHYMRLFGFGHVTPLDMSGEVAGLLRPPKDWSRLSLPSLSFGQELRTTPLQLALAYAVVASGGLKVVPRLLLNAPQPPFERVIKASTARTLNHMLQAVVTGGTGQAAAIPGLNVAGKTGTAQKLGIKSPDGRRLYIAYFVGFAPADDPRLVVLVMIDEPVGRIYGGSVSAPAFSRIMDFALKRTAYPDGPGSVDLAYLEKKQ